MFKKCEFDDQSNDVGSLLSSNPLYPEARPQVGVGV